MTAATPPTGRRPLAALAASLALGSCGAVPGALAQAPTPRPAGGGGGPSRSPQGPPVVLAVPPPCADRPGDVLGLVVEATGGPAPVGTVVVFGQPFRPRDLPIGARLVARVGGGGRGPVPVQLDVVTRHPDGSARFGLVSLALPSALRAPGDRLGVVLSRAAADGGGPAARPLDLSAALSGRRVVLEVSPLAPSGGGQGGAWRADLAALLLAAPRRDPWQVGPLAASARLSVPVPPGAVGGATSVRLVADLSARADGTLWVDAWLRNDVAMRPGGGAAAYAVRLDLDGREALRAEVTRHHHYTAWGRVLVSGSPAGGPAPAAPLVRHDAAYLAESGAVARYDLSSGVGEAILARLGAAVADPAWAEPLGAREVARQMHAGGGRPDIGPTTLSQAAWLITSDPRAAAYATGQAEAAGSPPWHHWDPRGGADGAGGWLDARRWDRLWTDGRGGPPPGGLAQPVAPNAETGWALDGPHQPDLSYVPYLLTGRRAFLDNLLSQAAWNVVSVWPYARGAPGAPGTAEGVNVVRRRQIRGAAWGMRQLDEAAWAAPEGDPNSAYLREVAAANWAWLRAQAPAWSNEQGEPHGWIPGEYGGSGALPPWQQDYFASTAAAAARRGGEDARAVLDWMSNFLVGRFFAEARGFPPNDGAAYLIAISPTGPAPAPSPPGRPGPYRTWAELGEATRARGMSNGAGWEKSRGDYPRWALASLAALADVAGRGETRERARRAYERLLAAEPPFTRPADHARVPTLNIVPEGMPRVPSHAPRCSAA